MAITAKKITRVANPKNIGGIGYNQYYAFEEDIDTFPEALTPNFLTAADFGALVTIPVDDPFVMKDGKYFHAFPCTEETGNVKSTLVGPTDSMAWENTASFQNAGNNDQLTGHIAFIGNKKVIILSTDLNGIVKVCGTQEYFARLATGEKDSGTKVADGNSLKHSFKAYSTVPCPTYLAPIPLDPVEA